MSRSGYTEDYDGPHYAYALWRGRVESATRGKRGQEFFRALLVALDAMPDKRLIADELEAGNGEVCAIGALGKYRGVDMSVIDPHDPGQVSDTFDIAQCLAQEVVFENDEYDTRETPEHRWERMRRWVVSQIAKPAETAVAP